MENDDDFDDIRELVSDYEASVGQGIQPFLDVDDTIDIAQYYDDNGQTGDARRVLLHGLSLHPGEPEILSFLVRITLVDEGDIEKARQYASQIERQDNIDYFLAHSDLLIAQAKFDEADEIIRNNIGQLTSDEQTDLCIEVAQMYVFAEEPHRADRWLRFCPQKDSVDYLELRGDVSLSLGKGRSGEKTYRRLIDIDAFSVPYWNNLAASQLMQGKLEEALDSTEFAIAIAPDDLRARHNKAYILLVAGDTKQAETMLESLYRETDGQTAGQTDYDVRVRILLSYGKLLLLKNDAARAVAVNEELREVISPLDSHAMEATHQLILSYSLASDIDKGMEVIKEELDDCSNEDYCELMVLKGYLLLRQSNAKKAAICFHKAISDDECTTNTVFHVCIAYYDFGFYAEATMMLLELIKSSKKPTGLAYLAMCLKRLDKTELYLEALNAACCQCPDEVGVVFADEIPQGVSPSDYYDYLVSHSGKPAEHTRNKKGK